MNKRKTVSEIIFFVAIAVGGTLIFLNAPKQSLKTSASLATTIDTLSENNRYYREDLVTLIGLLEKTTREANYSEAYKIVLVLSSKEPNSIKWKKEKVNIAYQAFLWEGEPKKWAKILYNNLTELNDTSTEVQAKKIFAEFYISKVPPMVTIRKMKSLLQRDPNNYVALIALGIWSLKSGQYQKALKYLEKATEIKITNPEAYYFLSLLYQQDNTGLSEIYLKKAKSYLPESKKNKLKNLNKLVF